MSQKVSNSQDRNHEQEHNSEMDVVSLKEKIENEQKALMEGKSVSHLNVLNTNQD